MILPDDFDPEHIRLEMINDVLIVRPDMSVIQAIIWVDALLELNPMEGSEQR